MILITFLLILICILLIAVLVKWSTKHQNREIIDEWFREDVDMETYWDSDEQDWVNNAELEQRKKQTEAKEKQFDTQFTKKTLKQLYDLYPEFENLDTQGFEKLKAIVLKSSTEIRQRAQKVKVNTRSAKK